METLEMKLNNQSYNISWGGIAKKALLITAAAAGISFLAGSCMCNTMSCTYDTYRKVTNFSVVEKYDKEKTINKLEDYEVNK